MSNDTAPASVVIARTTDAFSCAALVLAGVDATRLWRAGGTTALDVALLVGLCLAAAFPLAPLLAALFVAVGRARRGRRAAWLVGAVLATLPLPLALVDAPGGPTSTGVLATIAAAVVAALLAWRASRMELVPFAWAAGCAIGCVLVSAIDRSFGLTERVYATASPARIAAIAAALPYAVTVHGLGVAMLAKRAIEPDRASARARALTTGRERARAALPVLAPLALGVAVAVVAETASVGVYENARASLFAMSLLACAIGAMKLPRLRALGRVVLAIVALVGAGSLAAGVELLGPSRWQIASNSPLGVAIARRTPIFGAGTAAWLDRLSRTRGAAVGSRLADAARAWNARHASSSPSPIARSCVLVTMDALRFDHAGYSGVAPRGLTPEMDGLATRAVRFRRAYAVGGWTSISVPTLMWSRYARDVRFVPMYETSDARLFLSGALPRGTNVELVFQSPIHEPSRSLAELARAAGLRTVAVPNDEFTHYFEPALGFMRGFERSAPDVRSDAQAVDIAIEELRRLRDERFLLWVHLFGPHGPHERERGARGAWTNYASEVHESDRQLGRLLDALETSGRASDTAIVLSADHGEELFEHGKDGHGLALFEESIHVPMLLAHPSFAAHDVSEAVGLVDVAPTVLAILGLATPRSMEGFSLVPFLRGARERRPLVPVETWRKDRAGREDLRLVGAVDEEHKIVIDLLAGAFAAYDTRRDPHEHRSARLGGTDPASRQRLRLAEALAGWERAHRVER